jgi:hypothetical protein
MSKDLNLHVSGPLQWNFGLLAPACTSRKLEAIELIYNDVTTATLVLLISAVVFLLYKYKIEKTKFRLNIKIIHKKQVLGVEKCYTSKEHF